MTMPSSVARSFIATAAAKGGVNNTPPPSAAAAAASASSSDEKMTDVLFGQYDNLKLVSTTIPRLLSHQQLIDQYPTLGVDRETGELHQSTQSATNIRRKRKKQRETNPISFSLSQSSSSPSLSLSPVTPSPLIDSTLQTLIDRLDGATFVLDSSSSTAETVSYDESQQYIKQQIRENKYMLDIYDADHMDALSMEAGTFDGVEYRGCKQGAECKFKDPTYYQQIKGWKEHCPEGFICMQEYSPTDLQRIRQERRDKAPQSRNCIWDQAHYQMCSSITLLRYRKSDSNYDEALKRTFHNKTMDFFQRFCVTAGVPGGYRYEFVYKPVDDKFDVIIHPVPRVALLSMRIERMAGTGRRRINLDAYKYASPVIEPPTRGENLLHFT